MNNYIITLDKLQEIHKRLYIKDYNFFVNFLNGFHGNDIVDKFKNILMLWDRDVSPTLTFNNIDNKKINVQINYILPNINDVEKEIRFVIDDIVFIIGVPLKFESNIDDFSIYTLIKYIEISDKKINLTNLNYMEKAKIFEFLPAKTYNSLFSKIKEIDTMTVNFGNNLLKDTAINFLKKDPYSFLLTLFSSFDENYFRDVIYLLSPKIGSCLLKSTPLDIDYYSEKLYKEIEEQNSNLT